MSADRPLKPSGKKANHFVTGNRGNIGKSFFSILMGYLYNCNNRPFTLFDTDPHKSDVAAIYPGITDVTFDACNEIMVSYSTDAIKVLHYP